MGVERLRNVMTGEISDVETNSDEYLEKINEVYDHEGSARPKWEITGSHHVRRLDDGDVQEADHGYEHKPVPSNVLREEDFGPEVHPERAITQAEKDAGIDTWEQKMEELGSTRSDPQAHVEPLQKSAAEDRLAEGQKAAGTSGSSRRRSQKKASSSSGSGSSGSGSSSSGSSGSGSSGSGSSSGSSGSSGSSSS